MTLKLIRNSDGQEMKKGDAAKTFRGEDCEIISWEPSRGSGHVFVRILDSLSERRFYPSVIGCHLEGGGYSEE